MINLIDSLNRGPAFNHALIATYQFDAGFFETRVLERCRLINRCSYITVLTDRENYQQLCALDGLEEINRTYLVQDVPARRRFHPKVILLASPRAARLIVGSANFTAPGLTSNLEMATVINFQAEDGQHLAEMQSAFRFFKRLADDLPKTTFAQNVQKLHEDCAWLDEPTDQKSAFVHNLDTALFYQIEQRIGNEKIDEYFTLAPFFDEDLSTVQSIAKRFCPPRITIVIKDQDTNLNKDALRVFQQAFPSIDLQVMLLKPSEGEMLRRLHAKLHAFRRGRKALVLYGSANCTWPALMANSMQGNVETGVLIDEAGFSDPTSFFSEVGDLRRLADDESFVAQAGSAAPVQHHRLVRLIDVTRDDKNHLQVIAEKLSSVPSPRLRIEYLEEEQAKSFLLLLQLQDGEQHVALRTDGIQALDKYAVRACVIDGDDQQISGWRIIDNLEEGGRPLRFQRAWEESAKDASQFRHVLQTLCADNENPQELIEFLQVCNIRMDFPIRIREMRLREATPPVLHEQLDRESCKTIREAFAFFARRHLTKLENAVKLADRAQAPGVARIALSLAFAVESIWGWELDQLGPNQSFVSLERWNDFRSAISDLVESYRSLVALVKRYVVRIDGMEKALKLGTVPGDFSIEELRQHAQRWIETADVEIDQLLQNTRTRNQLGMAIALPVNSHEEIAASNWREIRNKMLTDVGMWI